jgi:hypothetical protein
MWATQNNQTVNMPGVVSDGRLFTNYNSDACVAESIKKMNGLKSNEEYRRFLVQNTEEIMKHNYSQMARENTTSYSHEQFNYGQPHLYKSIQDDSKPHGYEDTEVKQMYLSRQQLDDKKRRLMKDDY